MESLKDHFKFGDVVGFNNGVRLQFYPKLPCVHIKTSPYNIELQNRVTTQFCKANKVNQKAVHMNIIMWLGFLLSLSGKIDTHTHSTTPSCFLE